MTKTKCGGTCRTVFLCGLKGCGKTTIGSQAAKEAGVQWFDSDCEILRSNPDHGSCRELYKALGETEFRRLESLAVTNLAKRCKAGSGKAIVSLGGGACNSDDVLKTAKDSGMLVYLRQTETVLLQRMEKEGLPPYLSTEDTTNQFHRLYVMRDEIYSCFADYVIQLSNCTKDEAVEAIARLLT